MYQVLIASGSDELGKLLRANFEASGIKSSTHPLAVGLEQSLLAAKPHAAILVSGQTAHEVVEIGKMLRRHAALAKMPILLVLDDPINVSVGYGAFADAVLLKPVIFRDLLERTIELIDRVASRSDQQREIASCGDLTVDRTRFRVRRAGKEISLSIHLLRLLDVLVRNPGRVFSREELRAAAWPPGADIDLRTVNQHIRRLRAAIGQTGEEGPIRTVRGAGYSLDF